MIYAFSEILRKNQPNLKFQTRNVENAFVRHEGDSFYFEAILASDLVHNCDDETIKTMFKNAYEVLPSQGYFILNEVPFTEDSSLLDAFMSLKLALAKRRQFTLVNLKTQLQQAGFKQVESSKAGDFFHLIYARKD